MKTLKKGDVIMVNFGEADGTHVQKGFRPAIVLTADYILEHCNVSTIQVIPVTTSKKLPKLHIKLPSEVFLKDSYALPEQITTIDINQIVQLGGARRLGNSVMNDIKKAVYKQLGLRLCLENA